MDCDLIEYENALRSCTKPYQYAGGEFLSYNKDFDKADVRFLLAFPDKYEIGISNLGVRILYEQINKTENFMSDRFYAPEPDFTPSVLRAIESKRPVKEFDAIGFSLQWELAYPSVLKLLEMSDIPYKNSERTDTHPIIIGGGPCTYNPLPMSDFIDCFMIGDGEEVILEVCESLKQTKKLPRAERIKALSQIGGIWVKGYNERVTKRIVQLTPEGAPRRYPVPFSSSIQDRAVIEIRRGCGRMCRFCQAGHVTLPVRERAADDIISITKDLVKNTGYDEYSLLSLSSNDYSNINEVIKELSADFDKKKISVSLPSQRIDGFNIELANLVQNVRKSTITLAPEAGSQRLRNLIRKNISKSQIIDAALMLYENGWMKVKFYFIAGLPTETLKDMEETAELLNEIIYRTREIKKEKGLNHNFDITCTVSIFVPKPFTPLQWCPQMNMEEVTEHIKYLKSRINKHIKINYHENFVSQIEAVLTRGDETLCGYIENLYKKGCYLDGWSEYFNKDIWRDTAEECGFSISELAQKQFGLDEVLPWDFINTGLDKNWLKSEYNAAFNQPDEFNMQPSCEHKCVNCGVCPSLKTKKAAAKPYKSVSAPAIIKNDKNSNRTLYKYRIKVTKTGILKYLSHLDWQNTFFKSVSRTNLEVAFSLGFNPMMKISMGIALPLFIESETELIDMELLKDTPVDTVKTELERVLHKNAKVLSVKKLDNSSKSIDRTVYWAEYKVNAGTLYKIEKLRYNVEEVCSNDEIFITKTNKRGLNKKINIKNSIKSHGFENDCLFIVLKTGQGGEVPPVRADDFMRLVDADERFNIVRTRFFDENMNVL